MGVEPEHDAHARLPLRRRGAAQRHQDGGASRPTSARSRSTPTSGSPINAGQDGAFWMAVNHVILKEFHHDKQMPVLPRLRASATPTRRSWSSSSETDGALPRRASCSAPNRLAAYAGRGERRLEVPRLGRDDRRARGCPAAASGYRWGDEKGKWNLAAGGRRRRRADRPGAHVPRRRTTRCVQVALRRLRRRRTTMLARRAGPLRRDDATARSRSPPSTTC